MKYFYYLLIITILFIIYIEYSIGGILIRENSKGYLSFNILSLLNFMINPLYNKFLWNTYLLDVNYIFILILYSVFYYIYT